MSTDPNPDAPSSVDDGIHAMLSSTKEKAVDCLEKWESCVRRHPAKAVAAAVVAGMVLHRLPVRSILIAKIRIAAALAPPALLAYGAAKLCEILQEKAAESADPVAAIPPESAGDLY